ncbi:MAG TPA: hypothetical protein VLV83_10870 [Acidobacteriota bacterium]|nr:hypothetical protein [Acidobacteriota bacterium]
MPDSVTWVLCGFQLLIFVDLLWGCRTEIARQMPLLGAFVWWSLVAFVLLTVLWAFQGQVGSLYFHLYYMTCLIHFGFLTAMTLDIHRNCRLRWTWRSSGMIAVFLSIFLGHFLFASRVLGSLYVLAITLLVHIQAFLCAALNLALAYSSGVKLGRVRGAVLWAVTVATMLNYVVYVTPAFDLLPYEVMRHFIPWVSLAFWLLLVYGLRFKPEEAFQTARPKTRTT